MPSLKVVGLQFRVNAKLAQLVVPVICKLERALEMFRSLRSLSLETTSDEGDNETQGKRYQWDNYLSRRVECEPVHPAN